MNLLNAITNSLPIGLMIASIIAITIKEFTKALVSSSLGDPLPKRDRRVTLNPLKHIEPVGLFLMVFFTVGWGKPVETTSLYYKNRKRDTLITYILPSIANILAGIIFASIYFIIGMPWSPISLLLIQIAILNIHLALFNIIPIPPLDGAKVLNIFMNPNNVVRMASKEKLYQILLVFLIIWPRSPLISTINNLSLRIILFFS